MPLYITLYIENSVSWTTWSSLLVHSDDVSVSISASASVQRQSAVDVYDTKKKEDLRMCNKILFGV